MSYVLVTLPIHPAFIVQATEECYGATIGVKSLLFKDIEDLVAYTNGATNGAESILEHSIHPKVKELLIAVDSWISREGLFEK